MHGSLVHFLPLKLLLRHFYHRTFLRYSIRGCNISCPACHRMIFRNDCRLRMCDDESHRDGKSTTLCGMIWNRIFSHAVWDFALSVFRIAYICCVLPRFPRDCGSKRILRCFSIYGVLGQFSHSRSHVA